MSETLKKRGSTADLKWIRREDSQTADDLTNEDFSRFSCNLRMRITEDRYRPSRRGREKRR